MAARAHPQENAIEINTVASLQAEIAELRRQLNSLPLLTLLDPSNFSCSSFWDANWAASNVRVSAPNAWIPANGSNYSNQWVEVDLGRPHVINRVEIHGRGDAHQQYIKRFEIHYRMTIDDAYTVLPTLERDAYNQFDGVKDTHAQVIRSNFRPFTARYVRLLPREFHAYPACKWELHGYVA